MSTRALMIRRCVLERDVATGTDDYNNPLPPDYQPHGLPVPCWVYSRAKRQLVQDEHTVTVEDIRALFPKGADVRQGDRVVRFTDRLGVIVWEGPMLIETVMPRPDHQEAMVRRLT